VAANRRGKKETKATRLSSAEVPKALEALIMRLWAKDRPNYPSKSLKIPPMRDALWPVWPKTGPIRHHGASRVEPVKGRKP